jgi:hypothetical protein
MDGLFCCGPGWRNNFEQSETKRRFPRFDWLAGQGASSPDLALLVWCGRGLAICAGSHNLVWMAIRHIETSR